MPRFCVNTIAQPSGAHEVHNLDAGCHRLPVLPSQQALGTHADCGSAIAEARRRFPIVAGCHYCAPACQG